MKRAIIMYRVRIFQIIFNTEVCRVMLPKRPKGNSRLRPILIMVIKRQVHFMCLPFLKPSTCLHVRAYIGELCFVVLPRYL
jgi:hypothetical protein